LVLASDEDGSTLDALRFSLASDIVELVVLTADEVFLKTMREAAGSARRLWHVPSADKVSDLLVAGEVGIVVIDVQALNDAPSVFIGQIKRQFPDLVIVVAGNRDHETSLAGLISAGIVYRFIHKPMSPGRAKLFVEAAIKKHDEQRRRAAEIPERERDSRLPRAWLVGSAIGACALIAIAAWFNYRGSGEAAGPSQAAAAPKPAQAALLALAATALAANRLTEPKGDNALELYTKVLAGNASDASARAGLSEVHERLLARAENALLEERLDEAAAAIETARDAGVDGNRIAFLSAQLAKSREQVKAAQARIQVQTRPRSEPKAGEDRLTPLLNLAAQRLEDGRLLEPDRDNARFYVQEALRADPNNAAAQEVQRSLASRLLADARSAIDRRDFARATSLIQGATGLAAAANIEATQTLLAAARKQADADAWTSLLKSANERMQQDRLIEPSNDNAKYYLLTLRALDPSNPSLAAAEQDLSIRMVAKARRALSLEQYDAAQNWLDQAEDIGSASGETESVQRDLGAAIAKQRLLTTPVPVSQLNLLKSVQPVYPPKAESSKTEGWVELNFTVSESGKVKDVTVSAASIPGLFDAAAVRAVSQWRYQPVVRDSKPVPVRTQIRIRFVPG
jgi:TonB family protein